MLLARPLLQLYIPGDTDREGGEWITEEEEWESACIDDAPPLLKSSGWTEGAADEDDVEEGAQGPSRSE
jgi:hypothetical protein